MFRAAAGATGAIAPGPDGALWYTAGGYVGRMTLRGEVTRVPAPVTGDSDVAPGPDGAVWFSTGDGRVGRVVPGGGLSLVPVPAGAGHLPLTAGPDGGVWFLAGRIAGRVGLDGAVRTIPLPARAATGGPGSLATGPDGALWFTQGARAAIGRLGPNGGYSEATLPFPGPLGQIVAGPDGGMWFTAPAAKRVARIGMDGRVVSFPTSQFPGETIAAGPSNAIWFTMADGGRQSVVRMTPAGFTTFFQLTRGSARDLGVGPDGQIFMTRGIGVERLTPFLGARLIRSRTLVVNPFAGSVSVRLFCPKYDLVFCAGNITLRYRGRVIGGGPFSQRVNDAPATRMLLNGYGRRVMRGRGRRRVLMTIEQHDQGGSQRRSTRTVFLRRRR